MAAAAIVIPLVIQVTEGLIKDIIGLFNDDDDNVNKPFSCNLQSCMCLTPHHNSFVPSLQLASLINSSLNTRSSTGFYATRSMKYISRVWMARIGDTFTKNSPLASGVQSGEPAP